MNVLGNIKEPCSEYSQKLRRGQWSAFGLTVIAYMFSFFHRVAPASLSVQLQDSFHANSAELGVVSAIFFFAVMAMQIPTGILADTLGPRLILFFGCITAAIGAFIFAGSTNIFMACIGRLLIGVGAAIPFVALLRLNASWFDAKQFATLSGLTILFGNLGSILSTMPLEWMVRFVNWRSIINATGVISLITATLIILFVRDSPSAIGLQKFNQPAIVPVKEPWFSQFLVVIKNLKTWPCFWVSFGICGTFFMFSSLWAVPFLIKMNGFSKQDSSAHILVMILVHATTALVLGRLSDYLCNRKGLIIIFSTLYVITWLPMFFPLDLFSGESYVVFALQGVGSTSYTLIWAIAKEVNPFRSAGMAIGIVNTSTFLAAALFQPVIGLLIDKYGDVDGFTYSLILLLTLSAAGLLAAFCLTETGGKNVYNEQIR